MNGGDFDDLKYIFSDFVTECSEAMELAVEDVLNLETGGERDAVDRIFRTLHSIKGNSSMLGLMSLSSFVHKIEDTCSDIRSGEREMDKDTASIFLKCFDVIEDAFTQISDHGDDQIDYSRGYQLLESLSSDAPVAVSEVVLDDTVSPEPEISKVSNETVEKKVEAEPVIDAPASEPEPQPATIPEPEPQEVIKEDNSFVTQENIEAYAGDSARISEVSEIPESMVIERAGITGVRQNPTALVVEDDFVIRKAMVTYISKFMPCYVAKDGVEAIQAVSEAYSDEDRAPFDLIIMDIMMPTIDGLQASKAIRQIERSKSAVTFDTEAKLFIVSALSDDKTMLRAVYECGADTYIVKPVNFEELRRQLVRHRLIEPD